MTPKHTPEPWTAKGYTLHAADGRRLNNDYTRVSVDEMRANARRIVACVNALAGIPTEALEELWAFSCDEEQRRTLLASLLKSA
jgi:hypothetical protein